MSYRRVTEEERIHIYRWRQEGIRNNEIARMLGRSPSTISREVSRNSGGKGYRPKQANFKAKERAKRNGHRVLTEDMVKEISSRIKEKWTPEIISNRARHENRPFVSRETIYNVIYCDAQKGGDLWESLPRAHRKRKRRCPRKDSAGRGHIPNQQMIDTRPPIVETREEAGHWEGDLINGSSGTGNLVTLVERKTRFCLVGYSQSKEANEVKKVICDLFQNIPSELRLSLTLDNGKEFARHEAISDELRLDVYFAQPYHSWERGTNENTNGLIRRLYPKKSSFLKIKELELKEISQFVNERPRKCLNWLTPSEEMNALIVLAS